MSSSHSSRSLATLIFPRRVSRNRMIREKFRINRELDKRADRKRILCYSPFAREVDSEGAERTLRRVRSCSSTGGAKWVTQGRVEEGRGAEVSERVAKCNLKKKRTSSHSLAPLPPASSEQERRRKVPSGLQFSPHTVPTDSAADPYPSLFLIVASSRPRSCTFAHSSPFLFDFALNV